MKSDGTVYVWGNNVYGQTNVPAGSERCCRRRLWWLPRSRASSDGTVVGWGNMSQAPIYGQATNNPAAATSWPRCWQFAQPRVARGRNRGCLGIRRRWRDPIPQAATNVIGIAAGSGFSVALRANGTVVQWGSYILNYPVPSNLSNVVAISASGSHATALKNDGTVVSWGYEYTGSASNNVPPDLANVAAISSGSDHDFGFWARARPSSPSSRGTGPFVATARTNLSSRRQMRGRSARFLSMAVERHQCHRRHQ